MRLWPGVMRKRSAIGSRHISRQELLTYVSCRLERTTNRYPMNAPSKCWHRENRTLAGLRDYVGHESSRWFCTRVTSPVGPSRAVSSGPSCMAQTHRTFGSLGDKVHG